MASLVGEVGVIKALFESAQELPPEEVSAFLRKNALDSEVRAEVERLLGEYHEAASFLSTPGSCPGPFCHRPSAISSW